MKIITIIGARPQFIKHFPFEKACEGRLELKTIHTGQHYDANMSEIFFDQLGMKKPDYTLSTGSGNHGEQTASMMVEIEKIVLLEQPNGIVVYGDTNSTLAGALVASKLHIPIFHIEAGLRSFNKKMPEEVNRILTDHISDLLFTPSEAAKLNLTNEGITKGVYVIGDIMKDLIKYVKEKDLIGVRPIQESYYYVTLHRPYNTDDRERLKYILENLNDLSSKVIMALHPRTKNLMEKYSIDLNQFSNISFIEPQSYFHNLTYLTFSDGLITDSGGMQKEAYWLNKNCITIRTETEWIETVTLGGNVLVFDDLTLIQNAIDKSIENWDSNLYGDGNAATQIVNKIVGYV
ncbi:non-hydrolyzing UDP-N-acetylglucosamine 2-epimerase [Pedobacter boryungensis]|uniref:UDP-N-acetylglucosamine 2-epimerase (Non-hydrolyzing) n=1 Tax=Pedobacter boryungensis TaxID=869962 RepID=A0ABX2DFL7_9SPHI|nr:UDP-N-acetylglucosamine 2-epimerase (non-hydrolyzing) [Pedobacter boryungensis]NQX32730.1 UDP-N-acetylglucosamine 2-epimerase (non-hydrolyzing) [Pedobacter boryungensis]